MEDLKKLNGGNKNNMTDLTKEEMEIIHIAGIICKKLSDHFKKENWLYVEQFLEIVKKSKKEAKEMVKLIR